MDEWDGLENRCGLYGHRGFESHPLRQEDRHSRRFFVSIGNVVLEAVSGYNAPFNIVQVIQANPPLYPIRDIFVLGPVDQYNLYRD